MTAGSQQDAARLEDGLADGHAPLVEEARRAGFDAQSRRAQSLHAALAADIVKDSLAFGLKGDEIGAFGEPGGHFAVADGLGDGTFIRVGHNDLTTQRCNRQADLDGLPVQSEDEKVRLFHARASDFQALPWLWPCTQGRIELAMACDRFKMRCGIWGLTFGAACLLCPFDLPRPSRRAAPFGARFCSRPAMHGLNNPLRKLRKQ